MYRYLMLFAGALLLAAGAAAAPVELKIPQKIDASAPDIGLPQQPARGTTSSPPREWTP